MIKINWGHISHVFILVILFSIPFLTPFFHPFKDVQPVLTSTSLLFAILTGFLIGAATADYLRLQSLIANANARMISIFGEVKLIQPSSAPKVAHAIDQYMIAVLDYESLKYFSATQKEFNSI